MFNMAKFNMLPIDTTRAEFQRILTYSSQAQMTKLYGFWAADGDTASIGVYLRELGGPNRRRTPAMIARGRADVAAGRAFLSLALRDSVTALKQFVALKDTLISCSYDYRMQTVQLLISAGRLREAASQLERRWPGSSGCGDGFVDVVWTMERARVFERIGRRNEAAVNYAFVADAWRSADVELQTVGSRSAVCIGAPRHRSRRAEYRRCR